MKSLISHFSLALISLTLVACQGLDFTTDETTINDLDFTPIDLNQRLFFSEELLRRNIENGFIIRFDETELREIGFVLNSEEKALTGKYNWEIDSDNKLQVSYPSSVTCTSTKIKVLDNGFDTRITCTGGNPDNAKIENALLNPRAFNASDLSNKKITLNLSNGNKETFDFDDTTDQTLLYTTPNDPATSKNGIFKTSNYTNVIRIEYSDAKDYSLLVLLDGNLSEGALIDLRYNEDSDPQLQYIRIYSIPEVGVWNLEEETTSIEADN